MDEPTSALDQTARVSQRTAYFHMGDLSIVT
jgi:ABC-type phosphate transport system ATPase subunit